MLPAPTKAAACDDKNAPLVTVEAVNSDNGAAIAGASVMAQPPSSGATLGTTPLNFKSLSADTTYLIWVTLSGWEITGTQGGSSGSFDPTAKKVALDTSKPDGVPKDYCFLIKFGMRGLAKGSSFNLTGTGYALSYGLSWQSVAGASKYKVLKNGSPVAETGDVRYSANATPGTFNASVEAYDSSGKKIATSNSIPITVTAAGKTVTGQTATEDNSKACGCAGKGPIEYALCQIACTLLGVIAGFINLALEFLLKASGVKG
jgi:hypothetical protein